MRKNELSQQDLDRHQEFIHFLTDSGWKGTGVNQMFEEGDFVSEEAQMEYESNTTLLIAEFSAEMDAIILYIIAFSEKQVRFVIQYGENFQNVLREISEFQDKISERNYKKYIAKILRLCPETFVDIPDKGLYKLIEDDDVKESNML